MSKALRFAAVVAVFAIVSSATAQTTLEITPSATQIAGTGMSFSVEIRFTNYTNLQAFALPIYYNPAVIQHTGISNRGDLMPAPLCLGADFPARGEILIDCGSLTGGVTGTDGLAATITFQSVGNGSTEILFDPDQRTNQGAGGISQLSVRDTGNNEIPVTVTTGLVAVTSPLPDAAETKDYDDGDEDAIFPPANPTRARLRVVDAIGDHNKTTVALYEQAPPGDDAAPFSDPDAAITTFEVLDRYWEFATSLSGTFITHLAFDYSGLTSNNSMSGIDAPEFLRVCRRALGAGASDQWSVIPAAQTTVDQGNQEVILNTPPTSGEYAPGQYALCGDVGLLPVELVSFEVQLDANTAVLAWRTASETNNAGFEVEHRSALATTWERLDFIDGHGTTLEANSYIYRVDGIESGRHHFRLKQFDYDGTAEYSPEIELQVDVPGLFHLSQPYPSPFGPGQVSTKTQLTLQVNRGQHVAVEVFDVMGRQVAHLFDGYLASDQAQSLTLEADGLPSGLYFVRCLGEQFVATRSVFLMH